MTQEFQPHRGSITYWPDGESWGLARDRDGQEWFISRSTPLPYVRQGSEITFTGNPAPTRGQKRPTARNVCHFAIWNALTAAEADGVGAHQIVDALWELKLEAEGK